MPAPKKEQPLPNPFARLQSRWSAQSRTRRKLLTFGLALAFGFLGVPWLIWSAGQAMLGPYEHGNAFHFVGDFFVALARGELAFWIIALGPVAFVLLARLLWLGLRSRPG